MIKFLTTVTLLLLLAVAADADDLVLGVDFSQVGKNIHVSSLGSFDGLLPTGCEVDFPAWNKSTATSCIVTENGRSFLRFNVTHRDHSVLIRLPQAPIVTPGYYIVETVCRASLSPLNVHIRQLLTPYHQFWAKEIHSQGDQWIMDRATVYLDPTVKNTYTNLPYDTSNLRLYLSLKPGQTDIASIKLIKTTKEAVAASIPRPSSKTPNYFRNSRFPLGMQSGWNVNRDNLDGIVQADPKNIGPSGAPSLKIASKSHIRIFSEPFQTANPTVGNQITFACKGEGNWKVSVSGHRQGRVGGGYRTATFTLGPAWATQRIAFDPDPLDPALTVSFAGSGTLLIDSLMAYAGTDVREYQSAGECEIALASNDTTINATRIAFSDEPAKVHYCATGSLAGATLKAKVVNVYGQEKQLPDIKLGSEDFGETDSNDKQFIQHGSLSYDVFQDAPLGAFRIEAWVVRDGKRISPMNELVMTRIRRPIHWGKDAPNSPFGMHFFSNLRTVTTMKAAGVNWERVHDSALETTCWGYVEPEKGKWVFRDDIIANYRNAHIKILGMLGTAPKWASTYSGGQLPYYLDLCYQPKSLDEFSEYVRIMTSHYKGVIDEYDIGNEPWGAMFWHKAADPATGKYDVGPTPAADYAAYSKVAYETAKRVDSTIKLNGFSTFRTDWTKGVFDAGAYNDCDTLSYHFYTAETTGYPNDAVAQEYDDAMGYILKNARKPFKPVVMTEGNPIRGGEIPDSGMGKDDYAGIYNHSLTWKSDDNLLELCDSPCRFVVSHLALGIKQIFLYSDHAYSNLLTSPSFPVLLGADGYPHPALAAFSNMAWLIEDRSFVKVVPIADDVWAYIFEGRGGSVAVICGQRYARCTMKPSKDVELLDQFGNPSDGKYKGILIYVSSALSAQNLEKALKQGM